MSKNFELLQRLEREGLVPPAIEQEPTRASVPPSAKPNLTQPIFESLSKLVQRLFLSKSGSVRLVVFSGAEPGVGTSCIAGKATRVLACQTASPVCLLDASNSSTLTAVFGLPPSKTISDTPLQLQQTNIWLGSLGNASDTVLTREQTAKRMLELRREFQFVLLDAPPVGSGSEAIGLALQSDGIVLVVKAGATRRSAVQQIKADLEVAHAQLLGSVLNQSEYPIPDSIYKHL